MRSPARTARLALPLLTLLVACSPAPISPSPPSPPGAQAGGDARAPWSYEVTAAAGATEIVVRASLPPGSPAELSVDTGAEPFVRDLEIERNGVFEAVNVQGSSWFAPSCSSAGCRLRYRFLLAEAADSIEDFGVAAR